MRAYELQTGKPYYAVTFFEKDLKIPKIETYIFIDKESNIVNDLPAVEWRFQDPESYFKYGDYRKLKRTKFRQKPMILSVEEDCLYLIKDIEELIDMLIKLK